MRRGFSILLVLLFGLGPLSAIAGSEDAGLPACCRRHGAHHCTMAMQMAARMREADPQTHVAAPMTCPHFPGPQATFGAPVAALIATAGDLPAMRAQTFAASALRTIVPSAPSREHAGRGPPSTDLS
jgi:hypothetical protein